MRAARPNEGMRTWLTASLLAAAALGGLGAQRLVGHGSAAPATTRARQAAPSTTSTTTTTTATNPATPVTVAFVGDIALEGPAPSSLFGHVRRTLRSADVAIGNLEGTLGSGGVSKCGSSSTDCYAFQSPAQTARLLRGAGFDDLNVANNHAFDFGASGQQQTLQALARDRLRWSGRPGQITVLRVHGVRVAILGFAPYPWAQSLLDIPAAQRLVRRAAARADLVVAVLHAGAEGTDHQHVPRGTEYYLGENRGNERQFAHALVNAGADLVVASGPHVLRGLQLFRHHLIAYSLGNFATAGGALATEGILGESAILLVTLGEDGRLVSGKLLPVQIVGGAPQLSGSTGVIPRVNALSRSDFAGSAVVVAANGRLSVRR